MKIIPLLNGGMKWNVKPQFHVPFHTPIQQRQNNEDCYKGLIFVETSITKRESF